MKRADRIVIGFGLLLLLIISWAVALSAKTPAEKQLALLSQAAPLLEDGIYIRALPLLEEASSYDAAYTLQAEALLKTAYLGLIDKGGYRNKYTGLLEKQLGRKDAPADVFMEAALYYLSCAKIAETLSILKNGIAKTGSAELSALYEKNRYAYQLSRQVYEDVTAIYGPTVQVQNNGLWGIAKADGSPLIPCAYEKISTFSNDRAIVKKAGEISAVDSNNNRIAKLHQNAADFGNYAFNRLPLLTADGWKRSNGEFELGSMVFEAIGMSAGGYAAARENGAWGIIDSGATWQIAPQYDGLILDELGRCYAQNALFFRRNGAVQLLAAGVELPDLYEDAQPFADGYAAVKRDGKWGFIDSSGALRIGFVFDSALSFTQQLAAVEWEGQWGYINESADIAIPPVFLEAKSFSNGSAPVLTERGWQFITLIEYQKGATL